MAGIEALVEEAHGGSLWPQLEVQAEVRRLLGDGTSGRDALRAFLLTAGPRAWTTIDESMRAYYSPPRAAAGSSWWSRAWRARSAPTPEAPDAIVSGFASMDRDGRVREAAIRRLAAAADPLAGPFLTLRTIDWVAPVAAAATAALSERIASDPELLLASAPLVFALSNRLRRSDVERVLLERAAVDVTVRGALLALPDRRARRRLLSEERVRVAMALDELTALACSDPDPLVASLAGVEAVRRIGTTDASGGALHALLAGPAAVRRAVLDALAERGESGALAERFLFDRSPPVRAAASRLYRSAGDPAVAYRAALERGERAQIAITALATLGDKRDHEAILAALRSPRDALRRAAAGAVRWIARDRLRELLEPMLRDPSASVTREAERNLRAQAGDLDGARLWELATAPHRHHRRAACRLLRQRTAPERIEADLVALADEDADLRAEALGDLHSWLYRKAARAARGDLPTRRRLSERLAAVESRLPTHEVEQLRFHAALRPEDLDV